MSLFLDGLILFCIAFCVIAGVKNGFVRSVMGICKGAVALIVAYREKSLLTVALCACAAVFIVERIMEFI